MQKITPFLWFKDQAEEAANFYVSVIRNSRIKNIVRAGKSGPGPEGSVVTVAFELQGQAFAALNGNPQFPFTHAVSFMLDCDDQEEIDLYWEKLSEGGEKVQCGWLKDKYGVSWQVASQQMLQWIGDKEHPEKAARAMQAMMQMQKIDLAAMKKAYEG